jgi:hypothetical protein
MEDSLVWGLWSIFKTKSHWFQGWVKFSWPNGPMGQMFIRTYDSEFITEQFQLKCEEGFGAQFKDGVCCLYFPPFSNTTQFKIPFVFLIHVSHPFPLPSFSFTIPECPSTKFQCWWKPMGLGLKLLLRKGWPSTRGEAFWKTFKNDLQGLWGYWWLRVGFLA